MSLILEGFIDFYNTISNKAVSSKLSDKLINWNNGYIKVHNYSSYNDSRYGLLVGVELRNKKEIDFISSIKLTESISFSFLNTCLQDTSSMTLGLGIWYNEPSQKLFLARELFGLVPLYYIHIPNKFIAFSSSLVKLVQMTKLKNYLEVDHSRVITYSTFSQDQASDYTSNTFYKHIKSVLPGHILNITPEGTSNTSYVKFQPDKWTALHTIEEYGESFRQLLINSVHHNIKEESKIIGSHLSGGLDSSSVSTLVKHLHPNRPLNTFYYSTHGKNSNDRNFAVSVSQKIGSSHYEIVQSENDLEMIQLHTSLMGHPQGMLISPTSQGSLMKFASEIGCEILLNGNDGDSIVGSGLELMEQLFYQKNWKLLKKVLTKRVFFFAKANDYPDWESLSFEEKKFLVEQNFLFNRIASQIQKLKLPEFYSFYGEISKHFNISAGYFAKRGFKSIYKKIFTQKVPGLSILCDDFFDSVTKSSYYSEKLSQSLRGELPEKYQQNIQYVFNAQAIGQNEETFVLGNYYGFSNRSPYYDKQLFELCMSVPTLLQFGDGQGRAHFREAMKGLLPEEVRTRHQKAHIGSFGKIVTLRLYEQSKDFLMDSKEIWHYVDKQKFLNTVKFLQIEGLPNEQYNRSLVHITRTISLAVWLDWLRSNN